MHFTISFFHKIVDLSKFAKVNLSPFSLQILNGKNANVAANQEFFVMIPAAKS